MAELHPTVAAMHRHRQELQARRRAWIDEAIQRAGSGRALDRLAGWHNGRAHLLRRRGMNEEQGREVRYWLSRLRERDRRLMSRRHRGEA